MRGAVLFYGFARTFRNVMFKYKDNFALNNEDIFINIYDTYYPDDRDKVYTNGIVENVDPKIFYDIFGDKIKHIMLHKYSSQAFIDIVESNNMPPMNNINQWHFRSLSFFFSIKCVIDFKTIYENTHGFKYDYVILTRLDLEINSKFIIPYNLDKISFPIGEGYFPNGERRIGSLIVTGTNKNINDQILVGRSYMFDILSTLFLNAINYHKTNSIPFINEMLIGWHFIFNNIDFSAEDLCSYRICK